MLALFACTCGFASSGGTAKYKHIYIVRHGEKIATPETLEGVAPTSLSFEEAQQLETVQCLSEKGWARAYNLKTLFGKHGSIVKPDAIFSANYGEPLDCTDRHGWYRTQQTVSAVAADLGLEINNTYGFMPNLCGLEIPTSNYLVEHYPDLLPPIMEKLGVAITPEGTCSPYGNPPKNGDTNAGMCCNNKAAEAINATLKQPDIDNILVGWESVNIVWLTRALGVPKDKVGMWVSGTEEYDRIYKITYEVSASGDLTYLEFDGTMLQGFGTDETNWLGPIKGCGAVAKAPMTVEHLATK